MPYHSETFTEIMDEHHEAAILDPSEHRPFWVEFDDGIVSFGKGGEQEALVQWDAAAYYGFVPRKVYLGISTGRYTSGNWVFQQFCP